MFNKGDKEESVIISQEIAEEEFEKFIEMWEINLNPKSDDEKVDIAGLKEKIVNAIKKGRLVVNTDETLTYTISRTPKKNGQEIIVKRPVGQTYTEMDRYKDQQSMHKNNAVLASMTGKPPQFFADIDGIDLKPLQAVMSLFLAA